MLSLPAPPRSRRSRRRARRVAVDPRGLVEAIVAVAALHRVRSVVADHVVVARSAVTGRCRRRRRADRLRCRRRACRRRARRAGCRALAARELVRRRPRRSGVVARPTVDHVGTRPAVTVSLPGPPEKVSAVVSVSGSTGSLIATPSLPSPPSTVSAGGS